MIIPSLDILNNQIVRLYQGDYNLVKYYNYSLHDIIFAYLTSGVDIIHLVDLDAVRYPHKKRNILFDQIGKKFKNYIQIAGGIHSTNEINRLLSIGFKRVVIGSEIINNIQKVKSWIQDYGNERIVAALDINILKNNIKTIFISGWKKNTNICLEDILEKLLFLNIKHVLCTDISRDGTLSGPNFQLYKDLIKKFPMIHFQASGGIHNINDIIELKKIGVKEIIAGKSLLDVIFTISEAIQCWQNESFPVLM